jgi:hypothetical protein
MCDFAHFMIRASAEIGPANTVRLGKYRGIPASPQN